MRITDYIRRAFVAAAMNDVPKVDYEEQMRDTAMKIAIESLPPKVTALYKDPETRDYVTYFTFFLTTSSFGPSVMVPGIRSDELIAKIKVATDPLMALDKAQNKELEVIETKLRGAARAMTTRKALVEAFPEFEKYLPANDAVANRTLPVVVGLVDDFKKAGWPVQSKKAAEKTAVAA